MEEMRWDEMRRDELRYVDLVPDICLQEKSWDVNFSYELGKSYWTSSKEKVVCCRTVVLYKIPLLCNVYSEHS